MISNSKYRADIDGLRAIRPPAVKFASEAREGYDLGMLWKTVQELSDALFRRKTGVKRSTFLVMVEELKQAEAKARARDPRGNESSLDLLR